MNDMTTQAPPQDLIALAIQSKADVGTLERLFALKERDDANRAKADYFDAFAKFQAACPPIPKTKEVKNRDGTTRYKYAPLDVTVRTLRPAMLEHGFSHRFEIAREDDMVRVTCIAHHVGGHSEINPVLIPVFAGGGTNAAQDTGSAITYGERYSFEGVFGVIDATDDDDGAGAGPDSYGWLLQSCVTAREWLSSVVCVKENILDRGDLSAAAEAYAEMPRDVVRALFIAPTKGGLFTTEERAFCKDDKEFHTMVHTIRTDAGWYQRPENEV